MFKSFSIEENVSSTSKIKTSVQRNIRNKLLEQYPILNEYIDEIIPKKSENIHIAKCSNHLQIVLHHSEPLFFNVRDGPYFPTLRLLHKLPTMMKKVQADKGAIPFVLSGANIMCPGLTSAGASLEEDIEINQPVAVFAENKELPMAIGLTKMSTNEIREKNKGIGIETIHYLGDDLWRITKIN